jgi:hypothetical protein
MFRSVVLSLDLVAAGVRTMLVSQSHYAFGLQLTTATNAATLHLAVPEWCPFQAQPSLSLSLSLYRSTTAQQR